MNNREIVRFNKDGQVQINNMFAYAIQIIVEYKDEKGGLAFYADEQEQQYLFFGDEVFSAKFDDNTLYMSRSCEDIDVVEIAIVPSALFDNDNVDCKINIVDNNIELMSIATNQKMQIGDINTIITRVNAELNRRRASGSVGALSSNCKPSSNVVKGDKITRGTNSSTKPEDKSYVRISQPIRLIKNQHNLPLVGARILATGNATYSWVLQNVDALRAIPTTSSSTGCAASCTGLCSTGCYSGCSSCSGGCKSGCSGSCKGGCETHCFSYYSSCGGDCTYDGTGECC